MPLSLLLELTSRSPTWADRPRALRALAYALIQYGDPALAQALHDGPEGGGERPFTLAVLPDEAGLTGAGARTLVRVTALDDAAGVALRAGTAGRLAGEGVITFGRETVTLTGCRRDRPPLAEFCDYPGLAQAPFAPHIPLRFLSPTAFSQGGDRYLPLPVPDLLLRGWARRWNRFAPPGLAWSEGLVAAVAERTGLASAQIEVITVPLRPGKIVGFQGTIVLEALRPAFWADDHKRVWAALCAFSRFCGSGVRTTQGMGLTLPDRGERHDRAAASDRL